ncbi:MAG: hypothetical protein R3F35_08375 [Myxococcota bacterium]
MIRPSVGSFARSTAAWIASTASILLLSLAARGETPASEASGTIRFEIEFFAGDPEHPVSRAMVFASGRRLRIEQRRDGAPAPVFVYRGDRGRLYSISDSTRSYVQLEPALLAALGGSSARGARREVDDGLAALPQDQQRAFGHLLGVASLDPKHPEEPLVVSRTGGTDAVSGIGCERVELTRGGRLLAEGCIAEWRSVGLTPEDVEVFRSLAELVRNATGSRQPLPIEMVPGQPLDLVVQFGGLPLVFERAGRAREASAIRVASVERIAGGEALYEVPDGFAQRRGLSGLAGLASLLSPRRDAARAVPAAPASWSDAGRADGSASRGGRGAADGTSATGRAATEAVRSASASLHRPRRVQRAFEPRSSNRRIVYRPIRLFEDGDDGRGGRAADFGAALH